MTIDNLGIGGKRYKEAKHALLAALAAQEWKGGEAIPSERRLAERFGISIGTVRKAIDELVAENILVRHQGLGTFVAHHQRDRHFFRFFRVVGVGGDKRYPTVELLSFEQAKASASVARLLGIEANATVYQFSNSLALEGEVVMIDRIIVAEPRFRGLTEDALRERPSTLYNFYQDVFHVYVTGIEERLRATIADHTLAALLDVSAGAPLLEIQRVAYSYQQVPVEVRISSVNTAKHEYLGASTLTTPSYDRGVP
ncbi:GntR family transcriptional regulator [Paraburkholderia dipogonis]|uniref:GntR family transcriptional regulator n=1 Tax=Paraburkholderia dipogonis TaxID=1211383 RepID=UPI0038BDDBB9